MGGGEGKINKPKSKRVNIRKVTREKKKQWRKPHTRSEETLADTTLSKLKQCRSNPRANVRLSGKKRRVLAREAKRILAEKTEREGQMEVANRPTSVKTSDQDTHTMDTA